MKDPITRTETAFSTFPGKDDHVEAKQHFRTLPFLESIRQICFEHHLNINLSQIFWPIRVVICEEQSFYINIRSDHGYDIPKDPRRIDVVAHVAPQYNSVRKNDCFTIGYEIKTSYRDLISDTKCNVYSEAVNLLFLAVPKDLVPRALEKSKDNNYVGVYCMDEAVIYKMPIFRFPFEELSRQLQADALFRYRGVSELFLLSGDKYIKDTLITRNRIPDESVAFSDKEINT